MDRRAFVLAALAVAVASSESRAQPKVARIAYLSGLSAEVNKAWLSGLHQGLRDLGYVEGKNLTIESRYAAGQVDRLPALAAELAALKPDIFVVYGVQAALEAKKAAGSIPIVMANVQDPVASGLVHSLARPGGNITGLSDFHAASVTKRLELIKEVIPSASRIAILWVPNSATRPQVKDLEAAAPSLGVRLASHPVQRPADIAQAFTKMKNERVAAVLLLGDALLTANIPAIAELALKQRLPAMYTTRPFVQAGGLMSYGADFTDLFRRSATYVDKILKGAKPGDLPIEQPTKFDLVVNLKTAKALGIAVPRSVLLRADQVIE
jgi:putative tryptophan/tyrosine transport system substrate-binding protein